MSDGQVNIYSLARIATTAPIAATGAGATVVVPAVADKRVVVLSFMFTCSGDTDVTWEDTDGTNLSGVMRFSEFGGAEYDSALHPVIKTLPDKGLQILVGSAVTVGGLITYLYLTDYS